MSNERKIYKPKPVSGFPEWLPEERIVEQKWFDHIRRVFESYGFCSIETPSVEEIDVLLAKGEVDKEIYAIERIHKDPDEKSEARLALHFDQTVPFARYVAQHFNELVFPFKRYQMQRVWRGERPQMGRMREFYQCDIDVIHVDSLPLSFDAEVAAIMYEVLEGLNIGKVQLRINNRKILMGYLDSLNIPNQFGGYTKINSDQKTGILRDIDKLEKIGLDTTLERLEHTGLMLGLGGGLGAFIRPYLNIAATPYKKSDELKIAVDNLVSKIRAANPDLIDETALTLNEGIEELSFVLDNLKHLPEHAVVADLSIVRGLDYYTGTVYETRLLDVPEFTGSVCSGGRYDDLAGSYINKHLPGVGISIGFSRLFDVIRQSRPDLLKVGAKSPAHILMVLPSEEKRELAAATARTLRARGYNVELYHAPQKVKKQMEYASKKGIPYVWFPPFEDGNVHEVKNMATGEQSSADPNTWEK